MHHYDHRWHVAMRCHAISDHEIVYRVHTLHFHPLVSITYAIIFQTLYCAKLWKISIESSPLLMVTRRDLISEEADDTLPVVSCLQSYQMCGNINKNVIIIMNIVKRHKLSRIKHFSVFDNYIALKVLECA